jgi:translocation and assembly module TamB
VKWKTKHTVSTVALLVVAVVVALVVIAETGLATRWARRAIVSELERVTGGRVELAAFRFRLFSLHARLDGLTIHGLEPEGTPPLFHVDRVDVTLRPAALFHRRIDLGELALVHPAVHIRVEENGRTNLPHPRTAPSGKPLHQRLFEMTIRRLRLEDGYVLFNDVRVPLAAEGDHFDFAMDYYAPVGAADFYQGDLSWKHMELAARRYLPFPSDIAAKFTLTRAGFSLDSLAWKLPHSEIEARAQLASWTRPAWSFHYRLRMGLDDLRTILRKPHTPSGEVESTAEGSYSPGRWTLLGHYRAVGISTPYRWFHSPGMQSRGTLELTGDELTVPDFQAWLLGGEVDGRVRFDLHTLDFQTETTARGMNLSRIFAAVDNSDFPVHTLHWEALAGATAVTTWHADFRHVHSRGEVAWQPAPAGAPGEIPSTAQIHFDYRMDSNAVDVAESQVSTPTTAIHMHGVLGEHDSSMAVQADASDLSAWDDFINYLRGPEAERQTFAGRATWTGQVLGPVAHPTFAGQVHVTGAQYGRLRWDEITGGIRYSPEGLELTNARVRRGSSTAALTLSLEFTNWNFLPENRWSLEVSLNRADTDDLQQLFGTNYPAHAVLTGRFVADGTRAAPRLTGALAFTGVTAGSFRFDRVAGDLLVDHDEIRITRAEVVKGAGQITGDFAYRFADGQASFDLVGNALQLSQISEIQTKALPLGGRFDFRVRGKGPLLAPVGQGTFRLTDLKVGTEVTGTFLGNLTSDGRTLALEISSAMSTGKLDGSIRLGLGGAYPLEGSLEMQQINLDPFIEAGLHLRALTGHSRVDGRFALSGSLADPDSITVVADVSRVVFDYEYVKLENAGPLRLIYRRNEVRIERATLRGPDTDFTLAGLVRFNAERPLNLNIAGTLNLRLAQGLFPEVEARGIAQVDARIAGTMSRPNINGRAHLENALLGYDDLPASLSQVTGDFVFNRSQLVFSNVQASAGGGSLVLDGVVNYGTEVERVSYEISARARQVRVRYPAGMSWMTDADVHFTGNTQGAELTGRVVINRLLLSSGVDLASFLLVSRPAVAAGPGTVSPFLRNFQLDLSVVTGPDARILWQGAHMETDASLRVRGTWDRPVVLGHVHLLAGEMTFRGNRYRLVRGDLNFANPLRLDPVIDIEAVTTIQQYEVTLDFTGPASALRLSYRSDPPLPESDVIALLALGRTGQESELRTTTGAQAQQFGASALLSEAISAEVGGRIERLFGISRFQVDPFVGGAGTESNAAARVTIQQQITPNLQITYATNATSNQQQVIQIEYAVRPDISIQALRDINGTFGLDIVFKKRFK